mmetsp:Transcript_18107/g.45230  ORF Transcript_18107/g.45230 Transcript_18107/m.45230 type:complete len:205 (+) Transcript_18107:240-854(+)
MAGHAAQAPTECHHACAPAHTSRRRPLSSRYAHGSICLEKVLDLLEHLLLGRPERDRLLDSLAPAIPSNLHHCVEWDLVRGAFVAWHPHQEAAHQSQRRLVRDDQQRLVEFEHLNHHRVEPLNYVIVRLAARVAEANLVPLALVRLLREALLELRLGQPLGIAHKDLVDGAIDARDHLHPGLAHLLFRQVRVRHVLRRQYGALQ